VRPGNDDAANGWAGDPGELVYGLDLSRFADGNGDGFGDFAGAVEHLDYVASLGTTWIWLLPFYPSERRDNGYDVDDHVAIDPRFGDFDGLRALLARAHELGMRVLIDAVLHHTSDRHAWFVAACADPDGPAGRFFVWSEDDAVEPGDHPMFPGEEDAVWAFDETAGRYYHHQFYAFQPDLNATDPDVFEEIVNVLGFWLGIGVDGFRIDAALLLVQGKGRPGTDVADGAFFDRLRARLREVRPDVALLAEADESPELMAALTERGRFDAVIDFTLNNALVLALTRGRAEPLVGALRRLDGSIPPDARLNFLHNADEIDLQQLTEEERREAFAYFAPEPEMLIYGRGIRRGWAPMMEPTQRVRLTISLLYALPGVPLLLAGQELGVGDDLTVEGRGAARTTMQWDDTAWGGFTTAAESPLTLPAQAGGAYGYPTVNVRAQDGDDGSLLTLTRRISRLRHERGASAAGWTALDVGAPEVLALRRDGMVTLHNLSAETVTVSLPGTFEPLIAEGWTGHTLHPYGFAWLTPAPHGPGSTGCRVRGWGGDSVYRAAGWRGGLASQCARPVVEGRAHLLLRGAGRQTARMVQEAEADAPGSSTTRSVPELKASGGQVIGSTARPRRFSSGRGWSAVCTCTHGHSGPQSISTPVPPGAVSRTIASPSAERARSVKAWSMKVSPIGRGVRKSQIPPAASSTSARPVGISRSSVTSRTWPASSSSVQSSTRPGPATR